MRDKRIVFVLAFGLGLDCYSTPITLQNGPNKIVNEEIIFLLQVAKCQTHTEVEAVMTYDDAIVMLS
jgi:hypothetical protein